MKINEIIKENRKVPKKPSERVQTATRGLHVFSDKERANSDYTHYRLMMAVAMSNGCDPIDIDSKSWFGKRKTAHPYTQAEVDMLKKGYEAVGAAYDDINHGDLSSGEHPDVNKNNVVAKIKRNKYGV